MTVATIIKIKIWKYEEEKKNIYQKFLNLDA